MERAIVVGPVGLIPVFLSIEDSVAVVVAVVVVLLLVMSLLCDVESATIDVAIIL